MPNISLEKVLLDYEQGTFTITQLPIEVLMSYA